MNLPIALTLDRIVSSRSSSSSSSRRPRHALIAAVHLRRAPRSPTGSTGCIARRRNQVTTLGTLLDPVADKLLVAAALISLVQIDMVDAWMAVVDHRRGSWR